MDYSRAATASPDPDVISSDTASTERVALSIKEASNTSQDSTVEHSKRGETGILRAGAPLRYRKRALYLLAFYFPLLVIPWALTCVLAVRPITHPSYINQRGQYSLLTFLNIEYWPLAVRILNSVASLVTIPIVSALLAQAAVVYTQRRHRNQSLNIGQTFALADRGWADIILLWRARNNKHGRISTKFLWFGMALVLFCAAQQPLQSVLVQFKDLQVMTCNDNPIYIENDDISCYNLYHVSLGYDPEPADLAQLPRDLVVAEVSNKLMTANTLDFQLRMWPEPDVNVDDALAAERSTISWYYESNSAWSHGFYVTALPNNTQTGVLREHALRFNSSIQCEHISRDGMPTNCSGANPFVTSYIDEENIEIRICVPGDAASPIWSVSRDRQDVLEEAFIDVYVPKNATPYADDYSFTIKCTAETTRGYFELGNYLNNYTPGPLLTLWPQPEEMFTDFNDYLGVENDYGIPTTYDDSPARFTDWVLQDNPFSISSDPASGPLMMSLMSLFGNTSFFNILANSNYSDFMTARRTICETGRVPLTRFTIIEEFNDNSWCFYWNVLHPGYDGTPSGERVDAAEFLQTWFQGFSDTNNANEVFAFAMFLTHEAMLTNTASLTWDSTARAIYTSPGLTTIKPYVSHAATAVISSLMLVELIALTALAVYIYQVPTWTGSLDALAVARLGAFLKDSRLPAISSVDDIELLKKLDDIDGVVGVAEEETEDGEHNTEAGSSDEQADEQVVRLEVGGRGIVKRHHAHMQRRHALKFWRSSHGKKKRPKGHASEDRAMIA